jgi:hypothetical protein
LTQQQLLPDAVTPRQIVILKCSDANWIRMHLTTCRWKWSLVHTRDSFCLCCQLQFSQFVISRVLDLVCDSRNSLVLWLLLFIYKDTLFG